MPKNWNIINFNEDQKFLVLDTVDGKQQACRVTQINDDDKQIEIYYINWKKSHNEKSEFSHKPKGFQIFLGMQLSYTNIMVHSINKEILRTRLRETEKIHHTSSDLERKPRRDKNNKNPTKIFTLVRANSKHNYSHLSRIRIIRLRTW